jgi:hypothetical protein
LTYAKCALVPFVVAFIIVMLILYRKKTNQILLVVMLATLAAGALRLSQVQDDGQTMETVAIIMGGMALIWMITWISNVVANRRKRPKRVAK